MTPLAAVFPTDVATYMLDVLERRLPEHFAIIEREKGWEPRTIPPLSTLDHLAGEGFRVKTDTAPACLIGMFGNADPPAQTRTGTDVEWTMAVEVTAQGRDREDTLRARDVYMLAVAECLLDRVPRSGDGPVTALALEDIDLIPGADPATQQTVAQARLLFAVAVRGRIGRKLLPPDDSALAPGSPGGPPYDAYSPPAPWPVATSVEHTVDKEPIDQ